MKEVFHIRKTSNKIKDESFFRCGDHNNLLMAKIFLTNNCNKQCIRSKNRFIGQTDK